MYAWLRRHPRLVDGVLAAALAFGGLVTAIGLQRYLVIPVTVALTVPVIFRRTHPVGAFWTATAVGAIQLVTWSRPVPPDLAILVLLYTLAAYTTRRKSVLGLAACLFGSAAELGELYTHLVRYGVANWLMIGAVLLAGPSVLAWLLGDAMRYRRAYYLNLEERAARLERDRDVQAKMAAAAERARIARELHDVVAHNVSVMVVQADGAAYALASDPPGPRGDRRDRPASAGRDAGHARGAPPVRRNRIRDCVRPSRATGRRAPRHRANRRAVGKRATRRVVGHRPHHPRVLRLRPTRHRATHHHGGAIRNRRGLVGRYRRPGGHPADPDAGQADRPGARSAAGRPVP